jgi:hypothetical protein
MRTVTLIYLKKKKFYYCKSSKLFRPKLGQKDSCDTRVTSVTLAVLVFWAPDMSFVYAVQ